MKINLKFKAWTGLRTRRKAEVSAEQGDCAMSASVLPKSGVN